MIKCTNCGKTFADKDELQISQNKKTDEICHTCPGCMTDAYLIDAEYYLTRAELNIVLDALCCGARDLREAARDIHSRGYKLPTIEGQLMENFNQRAARMEALYDKLV